MIWVLTYVLALTKNSICSQWFRCVTLKDSLLFVENVKLGFKPPTHCKLEIYCTGLRNVKDGT